MKKITFLKNLRKKLESLDPNEVDDIIKEYKSYIEEKMESGMKEEDAVSSFGEVDELANELLKTYKSPHKKDSSDPIGDFSRKVITTIENFASDFSKKSNKEIMEFVIELGVLILFIIICHFPVSLLINLGRDIFNVFTNPINRIFFAIWKFVLEFTYAIVSIFVFLVIFENRYLKPKEKVKTKPKAKKEELKQEKKQFQIHENSIRNIGEWIIKIGVFFLKFFSIFLLFGITLYLIGMGIILFLCCYLLIQGVTYYGIYLVMLSFFFLGMIFFSLLFRFVIDKKIQKTHFLVGFLLSIFLLGCGCILATIEVTETEFINGVPNDLNTEVLTEELTMTKDTIFIGNIAHYNIDNSLETIRVYYEYYPLGTTMSTAVRKNGNFVYLRWNLQRIHISKELLFHMIHDLKEKKVYNYYIEPTIIITASEENIAQIKKNRQTYYSKENNYTSCEFVRTYTIEMIRDTKEEQEQIVVVSQYLEDDLATLHLKKEWADTLEVGSTYEFTFKTYQRYIDTDIESIFEENEIISMKKTDKVGIEQRQDNSCKKYY